MPSLFDSLPAAPLPAEQFDDLLARPGIRIERIVSTGQHDAPGQWQRQDWDEWVLVIEGAARVEVQHDPANRSNDAKAITLAKGDYLFLPAGTPHRVAFTDPNGPTVWLAVHIGSVV